MNLMDDDKNTTAVGNVAAGHRPALRGRLEACPTLEVNKELFSSLRSKVQAKVKALLAAFAVIESAPNVMQACAEIAARNGHQRGLTASVLYGKYFLFRRGNAEFPPGDWRLLVDPSQAGALWQAERVRVPDE